MKTLVSPRAVFAPKGNRFSPLRLVQWLLAANAAYRSRQVLGSLDPDRLHDLGLSEKQANAQANRPIWDVPEHWIQ